jgi:predicted phosphodiesterase
MTTLSWLHLSDWHQRGTEFDRDVVRNRLLDDLSRRTEIASELATIRLVIFSGDLAFAGQEQEYEAARNHLLEPVRERLGLKRSDFFFVPGNHDIDRAHVAKYAPVALKKPFETEKEMQEWLNGDRERAYLLEPFSAFSSFVSGYDGQASPAFGSIKSVEIDDKVVAILGLNSALMCGRRLDPKGEVNDYGVLTLGEPQLHQPLNTLEGADLRITVLHHSFEWLCEFDKTRVETALREKSDLILSGHVHRPGISVEQRPGSGTVTIPAGSSYDGRDRTDPSYANGYNFVFLDLVAGRGVVYLRRWDGQNSRWTADHATSPNGRFAFQVSRLVRAARQSRRRRTPVPPPGQREAAVVADYRRRLLESCDALELANLPSDHLVAQRELKLRQLFIPTRVVVEPDIPHPKGDREGLEERLAVWETERNERVIRRGADKSIRQEDPSPTYVSLPDAASNAVRG